MRLEDAHAACRRSIETHSKSFALASKFLPGRSAEDAAVVYAWCRRADDAIDHADPSDQPAALKTLWAELDALYAGHPGDEPELIAFAEVAQRRGIPKHYPAELLHGMDMDRAGTRYHTEGDLDLYCFRVAGTVGLMMSHVLGLRETGALVHATHLGMAMQLTNICRDVLEDWEMGRLYLPADELRAAGAVDMPDALGTPFRQEWVRSVATVVRSQLERAEPLYESGDRGLLALPGRSALAIRAARLIYAAIGDRVAARGHDVTRGRAVVPKRTKYWLVGRALVGSLGEVPRRLLRAKEPFGAETKASTVRYPDDVAPLPASTSVTR